LKLSKLKKQIKKAKNAKKSAKKLVKAKGKGKQAKQLKALQNKKKGASKMQLMSIVKKQILVVKKWQKKVQKALTNPKLNAQQKAKCTTKLQKLNAKLEKLQKELLSIK